jgi:hypothetical protein
MPAPGLWAVPRVEGGPMHAFVGRFEREPDTIAPDLVIVHCAHWDHTFVHRADRKLAAIAEHASQFPPASPKRGATSRARSAARTVSNLRRLTKYSASRSDFATQYVFVVIVA